MATSVDSLIDDVARRAVVDPEFRKLAVSNPEKALAHFTDKPLPAGISIRFVDNSGSTKTFVLPPLMTSNGELSEKELEQVAGGGFCLCTSCCISISL